MLEVRGIGRRYGNVAALTDVSFAVPRQQTYGIVGPRGGGKTTAVNVISGLERPDAGRIELDGRRLDRLAAHRIAKLGISRTFQQPQLLTESSVLEHLTIAQHQRGAAQLWQELLFTGQARRESRARIQRAEALLALAQLEAVADRPAATLPPAARRRLDIARALAQAPDYLFLDEPTAGSTVPERRWLERLIIEVLQGGVTVVLVEHDITWALDVCDRVAILQAGWLLVEGPAREVRVDARLREAYAPEIAE